MTNCFDALLDASDVGDRHRVLGVCGGPAAEDERAVDLVAGCSVLVTHPRALLRILEAKYINLSRSVCLLLDQQKMTFAIICLRTSPAFALFYFPPTPCSTDCPRSFQLDISWHMGVGRILPVGGKWRKLILSTRN